MSPLFYTWGTANREGEWTAMSHTASKCCNLQFWLLCYIVFLFILLPCSWKPRTPVIVCFSALPKLWASIFTGTTRAGRNEPCSTSMGLCSFTDTNLRLHFWRMNLWEIDPFNLKSSLKICEVRWLQARTVWIFFFLRHHALVLYLWKWQLAKENDV